MLTLANIHAGSKVLVFDTCAGLVLGAVMERMGGTSVLGTAEECNFYFPFFFPSALCVITHSFLTHPGYGSVIQMYPGGEPVRAGMESFGFPAHFHDMLHGFPICRVNALLAGTLDTTAKDPSAGRACFFFSLLKLSEMFIALLFPEETEKLESSTERPNKQNISRLVFLW